VAQEGFDSDIGLALTVVLLLLRVLVALGALRAGAVGSLQTPGLSIGALLGIVLGGFWNYAWPAVPLGAFAIVGSAAFLASSMKMPVTAVVLIIEFTRVGHDFLIPILFGVVGSITAFSLCTQHISTRHDDIPRPLSEELTDASTLNFLMSYDQKHFLTLEVNTPRGRKVSDSADRILRWRERGKNALAGSCLTGKCEAHDRRICFR
jgi:hypothetical protein